MFDRVAWKIGRALDVRQSLIEMQSLNEADAELLGLDRGFADMLPATDVDAPTANWPAGDR